MDIDPIIRWKMTAEETKAFRLAKIWEAECQKLLPGKQTSRLPQKTDPRKGYLFRVCWSVIREFGEKLKFEEFPHFVHANLVVVKSRKGYIAPTILVGERAWKRWWYWKCRYADAIHKCPDPPPGVDFRIAVELKNTKNFLAEKCDGEISISKLEKAYKSEDLLQWVQSGKISLYYIVLSPIIRKNANIPRLEERAMFSASLILSRVNEDLKRHFVREFRYEFKK